MLAHERKQGPPDVAESGQEEKPAAVDMERPRVLRVRESGSLGRPQRRLGSQPTLLISPACFDLGWNGRHPVVGQDALQRLPDDQRWVIDVSDGDKQVGAMDGESLSTDPAGA